MHVTTVGQAFWRALEGRDWEAARNLLHKDLVAEWPQSGERVRGPDAYIDLCRGFPEPWSIHLGRALSMGEQEATMAAVAHSTGVFYVASFLRIQNDRIWRAVEYWVEGNAEEPPDWHAHLVERFDSTGERPFEHLLAW